MTLTARDEGLRHRPVGALELFHWFSILGFSFFIFYGGFLLGVPEP